MHDTVKNLPELMRRATEELETDSIDLVRRGMRKGARLRRRRTVGLSFATAGAVLVTAVAVVAAQSIGPDRSDAPFAGNPTASAPTSKRTVDPANPVKADPASRNTLATLRRVVPARFRVTDPMHWGGVGFNAASIDVDEGKGRSELGVLLERRADFLKACPTAVSPHGRCKVLDDGSVLLWRELEPVYPRSSKYPAGKHPEDLGVKYNSIDLHRRDGVIISMQSYTSAEEKRSPKTRDRPPFSIAQLTSMAQSKLWQPPSTALPTYTKAK